MDGSARLALVTGASAGIGLHTALGLARAGFRVSWPGATRAHRAGAADRRRARRGRGAGVETALADFASLAAVRRWPRRCWRGMTGSIVLVNNAGLIAPRYQISQDGYELTVAVNHLAPFLLTNLLLDRLRASARRRARAHRHGRLAGASRRAARPRDMDRTRRTGAR